MKRVKRVKRVKRMKSAKRVKRETCLLSQILLVNLGLGEAKVAQKAQSNVKSQVQPDSSNSARSGFKGGRERREDKGTKRKKCVS